MWREDLHKRVRAWPWLQLFGRWYLLCETFSTTLRVSFTCLFSFDVLLHTCGYALSSPSSSLQTCRHWFYAAMASPLGTPLLLSFTLFISSRIFSSDGVFLFFLLFLFIPRLCDVLSLSPHSLFIHLLSSSSRVLSFFSVSAFAFFFELVSVTLVSHPFLPLFCLCCHLKLPFQSFRPS